MRKAFDQGKAALAFRGLSEEDLPELMPVGVDPASIGLTDHGEPPRKVDNSCDDGLPQNAHLPSNSILESTHQEDLSPPAGGVLLPATHEARMSAAEAIAENEIQQPPPTPGLAAPPGTVIHSIGMKLVPIPAGEFLMGSPDLDPDADDDEKPQHLVRITRPFLLRPGRSRNRNTRE